MIEIKFTGLLVVLTLVWFGIRLRYVLKCHQVDWAREVKFLMVYICVAVISRIVYFPKQLVDGRVGSLFLEFDKIFPLWVNLVPFIHLFDVYDGWLINILGNVAIFIPVGLVFPFCFQRLDSIFKAVLAGAGFSLLVELTQLPFYSRCSDVDDLLLNTLGTLVGALIYFGIKRLRSRHTKTR